MFSLLSLFKPKEPEVRENTFLVWEPCSKSHGEVLPGYVKYLLDLGFEVSVLTTPKNIKDGLFSRFKDEKLFINNMSQKQIKKYFKKSDLSKVKGVLVTTIGKLCDSVHYDDAYKTFNPAADRSKIFFVEHEAKASVDEGLWKENLITLRKLNYKDAKSVVVNPHYFGKTQSAAKNDGITRFISIGALRAKRNNANMIVDAVRKLHNEGIRNFKVTIVGKGHLNDIEKELRPYFEIKGRLPYDKMYDEIEKSDFILTSYDENNQNHRRYITTGTSGTFQLVYGFLKPCIILEEFAQINGFDDKNSIMYPKAEEYYKAFENAVSMSESEYAEMQNNLNASAEAIYAESKNNLKELINA